MIRRPDIPILLLGSLGKIRTAMRFQKLTFLYDQEVCRDESYNYRWVPHNFGPHSYELDGDIEKHVDAGFITLEERYNPVTQGYDMFYSLTGSGKDKFRDIVKNDKDIVDGIRGRLSMYQFHDTNVNLFVYMHDRYPEFMRIGEIANPIVQKRRR